MEQKPIKSREEDARHQKQASQYARSLIEASLDPLVTISTEGKITDMNQATVNITGIVREKLTGTDFLDYFTKPQKAREVYQEVFAKGSVADSPLTLRHKNGKLTDVLFNGSVYKDDKGNVLGVVIVARDITAQKANELNIANIANKELAYQNEEKGKRADELIIADKELAYQDIEKGKRADELIIANKELLFQNEEKEKRAAELIIANKELLFQNEEKEKRAAELIIANKELLFQNEEKEKRAAELIIANKELAFQNEEKEKRAAELIIANKVISDYKYALDESSIVATTNQKGIISYANNNLCKISKYSREELIGQDHRLINSGHHSKEFMQNLWSTIASGKVWKGELKNKAKDGTLYWVDSTIIPILNDKGKPYQYIAIRIDITFQKEMQEKLAFENEEKGKRADELSVANKELLFQNEEKEKRAAELIIANKELIFQNEEKEKRAAELVIADIELDFQNREKEKREIANKELEALSNSAKRASQYARSLIEASTDPLVTISPEGKITDVNEASVKVTGVSREKLIGTDFSDYFTEQEKAREGYKKVFEKSFVSDYPLTIRHRNGKLTDVLYNASVYKDDKGSVLGVFAAARDVTAQKLLSKYSLSLIEASRDPLVTISTEGKITDMNEATANITGMTREELKGSDFFDYFTEPQKAREVYQKVFAKGSVADSPLTLRHKEGKLTDVLFNGSVYKDDRGNVLGVVIVARDVTDQKRVATELNESKVFAEEATRIAEEAKIKAENATRIAEHAVNAKQQFLSNMSHEIRTPLNGIIGFTKILLRNETTEKQKYQLDAIKTSSDILLVLINDILDLAKIEAGKMSIEQTELKLSDLINTVLGTFELRFQEKELKINKQFDSRIPTILMGDPVRIHQILLNLLSNSVKFTKNTGQISISVNLLNEDDVNANIEFIVSDSGIGISDEKLETIFQPFMQSGSDTARKFGGTGLGLSIVKRLVDLMGGTISVKSKLDLGSFFTITLPFKKTSATEILKKTEIKIHQDELKRLGMLKILLVEDIPVNQFLAQTILHDFGFETDTAENGKIAIELLQKNEYDIVLMDLMMPEMTGFEATQYIRNKMEPPKSTIPIIALTADVTKADVDKCSEVGMNEYVSKPINETDLLTKIARLVNKTRDTESSAIATEEKIINLTYLKSHSPNNPKFLADMIAMLLKETPNYIADMKHCIAVEDWEGLHKSAHKIKPSINFLGFPTHISDAAKQMDDYASDKINLNLINDLFLKVENAFRQAYIELEKELKNIKS